MFAWLTQEIASINTRKFYVVDGPASEELRQAVERSDLAVPPSYKQFVLEFGNAALYRSGSQYLVQVFAAPREVVTDDNEVLLYFGRTDRSLAYFKESRLVANAESPVFEWRHK